MLKNYFLTTIRTLRQNPLYTTFSILGVALTFIFVCILFMLSDTIRGDYRLPGYADRTWLVYWLSDETQPRRNITPEFYRQYITRMKTPETVIIKNPERLVNVEIDGRSMMLNLAYVEGDYYDVCRFNFLEGRAITKVEMAENRPVAVICKSVAEEFFRNEPATGKTIELSGRNFEVVGVVDNVPLFDELSFSNVWVPLSFASGQPAFALYLTAKNKDSMSQVREELEMLLQKAGEDESNTIKLKTIRIFGEEKFALGSYSVTILFLLILMLVPALNILSLNIAKSHDRSEETAVRKVFGACARDIFGQLFLESVLLTTVGALIGMMITPMILTALDNVLLRSVFIPVTTGTRFNLGTMTLFIIPCILVFSFLSGSIPARLTSKRNIINILKGESE